MEQVQLSTAQPTQEVFKPRKLREAIFEAGSKIKTREERVAMRYAARHPEFLQESLDLAIAEGRLPEGSTLDDVVSSASGWIILLQIFAELLPLIIEALQNRTLQLNLLRRR